MNEQDKGTVYHTGHVPPYEAGPSFAPVTPEGADEFANSPLTHLIAGHDDSGEPTEQMGVIRSRYPEADDDDDASGASPALRKLLVGSIAVTAFAAIGSVIYLSNDHDDRNCGVVNKPACEQTFHTFTPSNPETADTLPTDDPTTETPSSPATTTPTPSASATTAKPAAHAKHMPKTNVPKQMAGGNSVTLSDANCGIWSDTNRLPLAIDGSGKASVVVDTRYKQGGACENDGFYDGATVYTGPSTASKANLSATFTTSNGKIINGSIVRVLGITCNQVQTRTPNGEKQSSALWLKVKANDTQTGYIAGVDAGFPDQATLRSMGYVEKYLSGSPAKSGNC